MGAHDPEVARADHPRRLDELLLTKGEHARPHDPRRVEPAEHGEDEHERDHALAEDPERDVVQPLADRRRKRDDEQQGGEGHRHFDDPGDDRVDPAAEVTRDDAHRDPDQHHAARREHRHLERDPGPVEQAKELVTAERSVGAEDEQRLVARVELVLYVRPRPDGQQVVVHAREEDVVRPVAEQLRGDRPTDRCHQHQEDDDEATRHRDLVAAEANPHLVPVRTRPDRLRPLAEIGPGLEADRRREADT